MRGVITAALSLAIASSLGGCSMLNTGFKSLSSQESSKLSAAQASIDFLFGDAPQAPDRETLLKAGYPVTYVQIGDAPRTILAAAVNGTDGQYWVSAGGEALTLWQGRVIRSSKLELENRIHTDNLAQDPLSCYLHAEAQAECPQSFERTIQLKRPVATFDAHNPQYEIVTLTLKSSFNRNGRDITETGTAVTTGASTAGPREHYEFSNSYRLSSDGNYVIESKQWLSPMHGYVNLEMVSLTSPNEPRGEPQITRFQTPVQVRNINGMEVAPRLNEFVTAMQRQLYPDSYWPGLRIHSDKLDQRFSARKAGMLKRLRMLEQTYRHDGETALADAAQVLTQQFQQWPLRASYVHGIDPAQMRLTVGENPALNPHDANKEYEIVLAPALALNTGLTTADIIKTERWLVQPDGSIRKLKPTTAGKAAESTNNKPGVTLTTIAEEHLPRGFRDVNAQLAMFLQHWDYTQAPVAALMPKEVLTQAQAGT